MSQLQLNAIAADYGVQEPAQVLYRPLEGGLGWYRLDMFGGSSRIVNVTFVCDGDEYEYLRDFYRTNVGKDCEPFDIDLITFGSAVSTHTGCHFIEDSMKLTQVTGLTFTVSCQLEVPPTEAESVDWSDTGTPFKIEVAPQLVGYTMTDGNEIYSTVQDGPVGTYRRSYLNAARRLTVTWFVESVSYDYLMECYRAWVASGGKPFVMDLFMDQATLTTHKCCIIPGTWRISQKGESYTINAELEVEPAPYAGEYVSHVLEPAGGVSLTIGWNDPATDEYATATVESAGSQIHNGEFVNLSQLFFKIITDPSFGGGGTTWHMNWTPSGGSTAQPSYSTGFHDGYVNPSTYAPAEDSAGTFDIYVTVVGFGDSNHIFMTQVPDGDFFNVSWGPVP